MTTETNRGMTTSIDADSLPGQTYAPAGDSQVTRLRRQMKGQLLFTSALQTACQPGDEAFPAETLRETVSMGVTERPAPRVLSGESPKCRRRRGGVSRKNQRQS